MWKANNEKLGPRLTLRRRLIVVFLVLTLGWGCSIPQMDASTEAGRRALIYEVNTLLSEKKCTEAVDLIEPAYYSSNSTNGIRKAFASAHACRAQIEFFPFLIALTGANIGTNELWEFLTEEFYNSDTNLLASRRESTFRAEDALMAILKDGTLLPTASEISADLFNIGSLEVVDRTNDANLYHMMVAMASIGAFQAENGAPNTTTYRKTTALPLDSQAALAASATTLEDGCGYAGAIVNMLDTMGQITTLVDPALSSSLQAAVSVFGVAIDGACQAGCSSGGACVAACTECPLNLRHRTVCATDVQSQCAAAGVIDFINTDAQGWQTHI